MHSTTTSKPNAITKPTKIMLPQQGNPLLCNMMQELTSAAAYVQPFVPANTTVALVLGSGLGNLTNHMAVQHRLPYADIPGFPVSTVKGHAGQLVIGTFQGVPVLAMQGRFHFYEGYSMHQIVFPMRVMKLLGITTLILSNAAGCLNLNWELGDLMLIDDHINLMPGNPLIGDLPESLGPRFPAMNDAYDLNLRQQFQQSAQQQQIAIRSGVYAAVTGPNYETRAEYRYLRTIGADAIGMSTVPEVIAARHMNMNCLAISVLTDICDPEHPRSISHEEVLRIAGHSEQRLTNILSEMIPRI